MPNIRRYQHQVDAIEQSCRENIVPAKSRKTSYSHTTFPRRFSMSLDLRNRKKTVCVFAKQYPDDVEGQALMKDEKEEIRLLLFNYHARRHGWMDVEDYIIPKKPYGLYRLRARYIALDRHGWSLPRIGRIPLLTTHENEAICTKIRDWLFVHKHITSSHVGALISRHTIEEVSKTFIYNFLKKNNFDLKDVVFTPPSRTRVNVSQVKTWLFIFFNALIGLPGFKADLTINADETMLSFNRQRNNCKMVTRNGDENYTVNTINTSFHQSAMNSVCYTDQFGHPPQLFTVPYDDTSFLGTLFTYGTDNVLIEGNAKGWLKHSHFLDYIEALIKWIERINGVLAESNHRYPYAGASDEWFLFIDGCSTHARAPSAELKRKLCDAKLNVIFLPPYATSFLQPLDVGVFAPVKARLGKSLRKMPKKETLKESLGRISWSLTYGT